MLPPHTIVAQVSHKQYSWLYNNQFIRNFSLFVTLGMKLVMGVPLNEHEEGVCKLARENTSNIFVAPNEIFNGTGIDPTLTLLDEQVDHSGIAMWASAAALNLPVGPVAAGPVQVENISNPPSDATQATVGDGFDSLHELLDASAASASTSDRLNPFWETCLNSSGTSQQSAGAAASIQPVGLMDTSYESAAARSVQASDNEIQAAIIGFIRSHCVGGKLNEVLVSDQHFIEEFKKVNPNSKIKLSTSVLTSQFKPLKTMDGFTEIRRRRSQSNALVLKPASGNVADFVDPKYVQQCQDEIAANGCSMVGIVGAHIAGIKLKNGRNCSGKPWVGKPGKRSASSSPSPASKKKRRVTKTGVDPSFETASEVANEGSQDECMDSEDENDDE